VFSKVLLGRLQPFADECIGEYQCGFRKGKLTVDQLLVISQIIEKKFEYRQNVWQVFVDFKKAYDSIHRESLYNIMYEFGIPCKLISLTKVCMNGTKYQVRVDNVLSEEFQVVTGLKQGDALSPLLFNIALEKAVRSIQRDNHGIDIGTNKIGILGFADDLNIIGDDEESVKQCTAVLINEAKTIGLNVNNKTKVMELLPGNNQVDNVVIQGHTFEKVRQFTYLGTSISGNNDWSIELNSRIIKAEKASFSLTKYLKSKLFSRKTKVNLYTAIIRPTLTYGCEVWPLTNKMEQKLMSFENKILRIICGPVYDNDLGVLAQKNKQRDPRLDRNTKDNQLCKSTKNKMVWARDEKIKL